MSADERINRIEVLLQEQTHLLASQIQISHDATARHEAALAKHEAMMAEHEAAMAQHDAMMAQNDAAIAKINATLDRLAEASLETERRWQAYLSRIQQ